MLITSSVLALAVVATAISLRQLRIETVLLKESLRRSGATSVALFELDREATSMARRVAATRADASDRIRTSRSLRGRTSR